MKSFLLSTFDLLRGFPERFVAAVRARPVVRWILLGLLGAVLLGQSIVILKKKETMQIGCFDLSRASRSDFDDYYQAARRLRTGDDLYHLKLLTKLGHKHSARKPTAAELCQIARKMRGVGTYLYPPLTAFLLGPISGLEYRNAAVIFQVLSLLVLALLVWFYLRSPAMRSALPEIGERWLVALLAGLLLLNFMSGNASNGNVGFFLLLLCGVGLAFSFRGAGGWNVRQSGKQAGLQCLGGALIGFAAVMKITPGFFGLVLLGGRRYVAIFGMALGALVGLLLPALALGWDGNAALFGDWYVFIIKNFSNLSIVRPWANNQTISAAFGKWFLPGSDAAQGDYGLPWQIFSGTLLQQRTSAAGLVRLLNLVMVALGLVSAGAIALRGMFRRAEVPYGGRTWVDLTVVAVLCSLVASGVSWFHAYCVLFIPIFWMLARLLGAKGSGQPAAGLLDRSFLWVLGFFGLVYALLPADGRRAIAVYSVFLVLMVAFYVAYCVRLMRTALRPGG